MSMENRLKHIESKVLKSGSFVKGMNIMKQMVTANETNNREAIPNLLIKLWNNGRKTT